MKIVVLGGNGFLGRSLSRLASSHLCPDFDIISLDKSIIDLTVSNSSDLLFQTLQLIQPDILLQLACIKRQSADSLNVYNLNNQISLQTATALSRLDIKLIYLSSCAVYGEKNNQNLFSESSQICPTSYYGSHKIESEEIYQKYLSPDNLLILRPPLIYSHRQSEGYHPGSFASEALNCSQISLWGDGTEIREFININDAINIILSFSRLPVSGLFNMVCGYSHSYIDLARHICSYKPVSIVHRDRSGPIVNHTYDASKIRSILPNYQFLSPFTAIDMLFKPPIL